MTNDPSNDAQDTAFLSRWSKRKASVKKSDPDSSEVAENQEKADPQASDILAETEEEQALSDEGLCERYELPHPDECETPEQLDSFFSKPLPDRLKQLAMRRLWRINPLFKFADEMVEYGENYTDAATVIPDMQTAYKVGKGYLDKILAEQEEQEAAELLAQASNDSDSVDLGDEKATEKIAQNTEIEEEKNNDDQADEATDDQKETALAQQDEVAASPSDTPKPQQIVHDVENTAAGQTGEGEEIKQVHPRPRRMVFLKK